MKLQGKIFIIAGIVIVLILIGWSIFTLMNQNKNTTDTTAANSIIDTSSTIGARDVVKRENVETSFKDLAKDFGDAEDSGVLVSDASVLAESVKFKMTMTKNDAPAEVYVSKFTYKDKETLNQNHPISAEQSDVVEGIGELARFYTFAPVAADWRAVLMVVKDNTIYTFTLMQNYNQGLGITETAAKEALTNLARTATFEDKARQTK